MATVAFHQDTLHTFSYDAAGRLVKEDILDNSTAKPSRSNHTPTTIKAKYLKSVARKWTDTFVYDIMVYLKQPMN